MQNFFAKYKAFPTLEAVVVELASREQRTLSDQEFEDAKSFVVGTERDPDLNVQWMFERTEKFAQEKAIVNAVKASVTILNDDTGKVPRSAIPKMMTEALAVNFNSRIGVDYVADAPDRFERIHTKVKKYPFDIDILNTITDGGFEPGTLNVWMAGTHVGKSLILGHCAAAALEQGRNVLYISLEMSEDMISRRLDARALGVDFDMLRMVPKDNYLAKFERMGGPGRLILQQFPSGSAHAGHFRHLIDELRLKQNFVPDEVIVDYLNICASQTYKPGTVGLYERVMSISVELRGLGVEYGFPVNSATQTNRGGFTSSDPGLEDVADSFGLPMTADFMAAVVTNDELNNLSQMMIIQHKNRYRDYLRDRRFVVGVDRSRFRLRNVVISPQPQPGSAPLPADAKVAYQVSPDKFEGFK